MVCNIETKICKTCKIEKHLYMYSKHKSMKDGLQHTCKLCFCYYARENKIYLQKYRKEWWNKNKETKHIKHKTSHLKRTYNLSLDDYNTLLLKQDKKCLICNKEEKVFDSRVNKIVSLSVDHDHKTGKVRGLLCKDCNRGLGCFKDNIESFKRAVEYLKGI